MPPEKPPIESVSGGVLLRVRVQPKASSNRVEVRAEGVIAVRLTAPPVDGAANSALCDFLAGVLRTPKRCVSLKSGSRSREKTLMVEGVTEAVARERLGF